MTWINFSILVAICYAAYYGFNIVFDILKPSASGPKDNTETLTFTESLQPTVVADSEDTDTAIRPVVTQDSNQNDLLNNLKKEVETTESEHQPLSYDESDTIQPTMIETVVQNPLSGGVSYKDLMKLCREKAIVETSKHAFA